MALAKRIAALGTRMCCTANRLYHVIKTGIIVVEMILCDAIVRHSIKDFALGLVAVDCCLSNLCPKAGISTFDILRLFFKQELINPLLDLVRSSFGSKDFHTLGEKAEGLFKNKLCSSKEVKYR